MIEKPDIDALMAGELGEWLQAQALVRDAAREKCNGRLVKSAYVLLPLAAFLLFGPDWNVELKMWLVAASAILAGVWIYAPRAKAIRQTKEGINSALAAALGLTYSHDCEPGAGFERARLFRMLPGYSRANFEDLWAGQIGSRAFTLHEAHLEQQRQSDITRKLAAWAAILAVPTAIAGIYGMNFKHMPELDNPLGYPAIILAMILITASMLIYFKRRKWL